MGQHLSGINSQIAEWINKDEVVLSSNSIVSDESIKLFFSMETFSDRTNQIQYDKHSEELLIKQIEKYLLKLTGTEECIQMNTNIDKLIVENAFLPLIESYKKKACQRNPCRIKM